MAMAGWRLELRQAARGKELLLLGDASASAGAVSFFNFAAVISINLAVLNLLPIPVLDGGHIVFLLLEKIRRKPLSERALLLSQRIGMAFIVLTLSVVVITLVARRFEELMACLTAQTQTLGQDPPTPVCAERVVFPQPKRPGGGGGGTTTLKVEIEILFELLIVLFDLLEFQKGGDFSVDPDTGDLTYVDPPGTPWTYDPDTGLWNDGLGGSTATPWDTTGGLGGGPDGVGGGGPGFPRFGRLGGPQSVNDGQAVACTGLCPFARATGAGAWPGSDIRRRRCHAPSVLATEELSNALPDEGRRPARRDRGRGASCGGARLLAVQIDAERTTPWRRADRTRVRIHARTRPSWRWLLRTYRGAGWRQCTAAAAGLGGCHGVVPARSHSERHGEGGRCQEGDAQGRKETDRRRRPCREGDRGEPSKGDGPIALLC